MKPKTLTNKRAKVRAFTRAKGLHQKALFDLTVMYCYETREVFGNDRKPFVELFNKQWHEYCFRKRDGMVDLDQDSFMKWVNDKKSVTNLRSALKINFEPTGLKKLKYIFSKY